MADTGRARDLGVLMAPDHDCSRGNELDEIHKQIDELAKYPLMVVKLQSDSEHIKRTVDMLCIEVHELTGAVQKLVVSQATSQEILNQLAQTKNEVKKEIDSCGEQCLQHRMAAGSRVGGLETLMHGKDGAPGLIARVEQLETVARILKWIGIITIGTAVTTGIAAVVLMLLQR